MQATRNQVFLIDVIQLDIHSEDWNQLGRQIFNNMEILKLGELLIKSSMMSPF